MIRHTLVLLSLALFAATLSPVRAQSLDAFKRRLATSSAAGARVEAEEYAEAAGAVQRAARDHVRTRLRGYRVCVYIDNGQSGQDARAGAVAARNLLAEHFPDVRVRMVYENPYFKVKAGDCLTAEEAIILKGRLSSVFPNAFPIREELTLSDLLD